MERFLLWDREADGLSSVRSSEAAHYRYKPVPPGFKRDLLLSKAETVRGADFASVRAYLRKEKKSAVQQQLGEINEKM